MNPADELHFHALMRDPTQADGGHRAALFLVDKMGQREGHELAVEMWEATQDQIGEQIILTVKLLAGVIEERKEMGVEKCLLQIHSTLMWWADFQQAFREGWPLTLAEYAIEDAKAKEDS